MKLKLCLAVGLLGCLISNMAMANRAIAQIIPDRTLPQPSRVDRNGNTQVITEGTAVGQNLFHSFRLFSIQNGESASFQNISSSIQNIITRVTESSASRINGLIEALQSDGTVSSANLFLINPNGILFGANASLNLGGSFLATTGDRLQFSDGFEFRTNGTQSSSLLTISTPIGIQFGRNPGAIRNASVANLVQDDFGRPLQGGLQVSEGETLALIGDRLHIAGGVMIAPGGRIELGSVGGESSVSLTAIASGWRVGYGDVQNFSDIAFTDTALLDTTAAGNGGWQIQGREIVLTDNSTLTAYTEGSQNGGAALIRGETLELTGRSFISFLTLGAGRSGSLRIGVDRLFIDEGSQIVTATSGAGQGGDLRITASERIALNGGLSTPQFFLNTGLFAQANPDAAETSRAGDITLNTPSLSLQNGAQISTTTFGAADAGDLQIVADRIELSGALLRPNGSLLTEVNGRIYPTGLFTDTDANTSGNGGNLQIDTQRLSLQTGAFLQTNTEGSGRAGDLTIRATESVEVSGRSADGRIPTTLFAASGGLPTLPGGGEQTATGQGGRLQITTAELRVLEGGAIAVTSLNPNLPQTVGAGTLQIRAESIQLNNGGRLLSDSASGNGGNIRLQTQSVIALSRNSQISATAGVDDRPGNGGNINIRTPNGFIIASPQQDNDIIANAFEGRGGNINIDTRGLIGITARRAVPGNQTNDIDASSALGAPGTIRINQTELDPTRGLTELPVATAPPEPLQTCGTPTAGNAGRNRGDRTPTTFFNIGRGGIAPAPDALLESDDITDDIRLRSQSLTVAIDSPVLSSSTSSNLSLNTSSDTSPDLSSGDSMGVEAAGWAIDGAGRVRLMANVPHSEIQGCALR